MTKLTLRQRELLLAFKDNHDEGVKSPPYHQPFGVTRLTLGGEGPAMTGLIQRGFVEERDRLFYLTELGVRVASEIERPAMTTVPPSRFSHDG